MKAYYVENNGYDAILIPESNQIWISPNKKDIEIFASSNPNFGDWEGAYEESLEEVLPNIESVRKYWEASPRSLVIAENDDGNINIFSPESWNGRLEEYGLVNSKA